MPAATPVRRDLAAAAAALRATLRSHGPDGPAVAAFLSAVDACPRRDRIVRRLAVTWAELAVTAYVARVPGYAELEHRAWSLVASAGVGVVSRAALRELRHDMIDLAVAQEEPESRRASGPPAYVDQDELRWLLRSEAAAVRLDATLNGDRPSLRAARDLLPWIEHTLATLAVPVPGAGLAEIADAERADRRERCRAGRDRRVLAPAAGVRPGRRAAGARRHRTAAAPDPELVVAPAARRPARPRRAQEGAGQGSRMTLPPAWPAWTKRWASAASASG